MALNEKEWLDQIYRQLEKNIGYTDAFGTSIADSTTNEADISAAYPYNPERWRVFVNGTRQLIQYGSISQFNDQPDYHELIPAQGETVTLRTAERFRYVVGYVIEPSMAFGFSRLLETGDKIVVGYGKSDLHNNMANADGWFFIYTPSLGDYEVEIAEYRNGTKVSSKTVSTNKAVNIWKRMAQRINWYNVGNSEYIETFTINGDQFNPIIGKTSVDDGRGPQNGNQHVEFSIQRGASSSAITMECGSVGLKTLGNVTGLVRTKPTEQSHTFTTTGSWVPILAIRIDPDRGNVTCQLTNLDISSWGGSGDVYLLAQVHDPSEVLDSGDNELTDGDYSTPEFHNPINSVIEVSTNVAKAPDQSGTTQTSITRGGNGPGGYNIGFISFNQSGSGNNKLSFTNERTRKRSINPGDVVVIWGEADNAEALKYKIDTEQDF